MKSKNGRLQPCLTETLPDGSAFDMILVEGGRFLMGSEDEDAPDREKPVHEVELNNFYLGKFPVTQALWKAVIGDDNNPSYFKGDKRPVERVSWEEAQAFIQRLNRLTGKTYRLPTEAEWEYAARGGIYSQGFVYSGSDKLKQVGWYNENSSGETHDVGLLLGNELDIYDMSGNVYEWCEDDYHDSYEGAPKDGSAWIDAPARGALRVLRGGSYFFSALSCRPAYRSWPRPGSRFYYIGFRLALPLQLTGKPDGFH